MGCTRISNKQELEKAVEKIGNWEELCTKLEVPKFVMQYLCYSSERSETKKSKCLKVYFNSEQACWEHIVRVIADFPSLKSIAREIADTKIDHAITDQL